MSYTLDLLAQCHFEFCTKWRLVTMVQCPSLISDLLSLSQSFLPVEVSLKVNPKFIVSCPLLGDRRGKKRFETQRQVR